MTHLLLVNFLAWMTGSTLELASFDSSLDLLACVPLKVLADCLHHDKRCVIVTIIQIDVWEACLFTPKEGYLSTWSLADKAAVVLGAIVVHMVELLEGPERYH
jgi:hypothetical protein